MGKLFQELDEMFATDVVDDDLMVIEDVSSDTTKRIKWSELQKRIVIENENLGEGVVESHNIDFTTFPFEITGIYPRFFNQSNQSLSSPTSYNYTHNLPRALESGEQILLIPVAAKWVTVELLSNTSTTFTFTLNCVVNTSVGKSSWSAIYFKAN